MTLQKGSFHLILSSYHHHPTTLCHLSSSAVLCTLPPRSESTMFLLCSFLALFFFPPFSSTPFLHLFFLSPSPYSTSVLPCGLLGWSVSFGLFALASICLCLICSLYLLGYSGYAFCVLSSRRSRRLHAFRMRSQRVRLMSKIFLMFIQFNSLGMSATANSTRRLAYHHIAEYSLQNPITDIIFLPVDPVIAPLVIPRDKAVRANTFGYVNRLQKGYGHNCSWLTRFCVTLGVLWALARPIDAEDGSPSTLGWFVTAVLSRPQQSLLANGSGWNLLADLLSLCSAVSECFSVCTPGVIISLSLATGLVTLALSVSSDNFAFSSIWLKKFFPGLHFALVQAPFLNFAGTEEEFRHLADTPDDADMASEYGSDEGGSQGNSPSSSRSSSPSHPGNKFFSQLAQPSTTPGIIRMEQILSLPLPPS